jgi:hypothetical protein
MGCGPEPVGCMQGDDGRCLPPSPCQGLSFDCSSPSLEIHRITSTSERPRGPKADGAVGDIRLSSDRVTAVLSGIDAPRGLAPSGGALIDLVPASGHSDDELNSVFQAFGILPDDAARYTSVDLIDASPNFVAAMFRGHLDLRPDLDVVTRYELRPCEPGLRVRTELYHGARDPLSVLPADAYFWGDRSVTPFVPLPGQGYVHPELDLEKIAEAFRTSPFVAGDAHTPESSAYAVVACDEPAAHGFHSETLSAIGREPVLLMPGDSVAFERFIAVSEGPGQARATGVAVEVREQLFGERTTRVSGRVVDEGGAPVGADERRASLLFSELEEAASTKRPWAEAVPDADGRFVVRLPRGKRYVADVFVLGRARGKSVRFSTEGSEAALGDVTAPDPGTVTVHVTRADGTPLVAELVMVPRKPTVPDDVRGSVFGVFDEPRCVPFLGPPHGPSPACNRVLVDASGTAEFVAPPGSYYVYAHHGPFWSLSRKELDIVGGARHEASFTLEPLPLLPEGVLSADFHVHAGASFDSSFPERDRALSFVAQGVDVIAATDHDVITSYDRALEELGLSDRVRVMPGVETTGQILFLRPPGADIPRVIGHFNFWPLRYDPSRPRNGAPDDERVEPGELFDRVAELYDGQGVAELNHPFLGADLGRDQGYLAAIAYDPRRPVPVRADNTHEAELVRRPAGGHRNLDFDVQEVMNGTSVEQFLRYRTGWFSFLDQGILRAGTANSDSHTLAIEVLGTPRNLVFGGHALVGFDRERFNRSVRRGQMVGTTGPVIVACLSGGESECQGPSLEPQRPSADAELDVVVRAAPFVPVEEVRFIVNGRVAKTVSLDASPPRDPFGISGLERYSGSVPLRELSSSQHDVWLVVEAGMRLPLAGDLQDHDGLVDTTDNNGDGRVDASDGPGEFAEPGRVAESDARFHIDALAPGDLPTAFTNPWLVDWDGDGWDPPGLP